MRWPGRKPCSGTARWACSSSRRSRPGRRAWPRRWQPQRACRSSVAATVRLRCGRSASTSTRSATSRPAAARRWNTSRARNCLVLRFWKKSDVANEPVSVPLPPSGRRPIIAGNWKMNYTHLEAIGLTQKLAFSLTPEQFAAAEMVVLPPFISIRSVQTLIDGDRIPIKYGAQDLSPHDSGAYTGDVSGPMLAKLGCTYVIVGHSERRQYHAEDDATVNAKLVAAFRNGLTPILCVGEPLPVRETQDHIAHCCSQ